MGQKHDILVACSSSKGVERGALPSSHRHIKVNMGISPERYLYIVDLQVDLSYQKQKIKFIVFY